MGEREYASYVASLGGCGGGVQKCHERSDPQCRLHGVTGQASGAMPARPRQEAPPPGEHKATPARPRQEAPPPGEHKATASSSASNTKQVKRPFHDEEGTVPAAPRRRPNGGGTPEKVLFKTHKVLHLQLRSQARQADGEVREVHGGGAQQGRASHLQAVPT